MPHKKEIEPGSFGNRINLMKENCLSSTSNAKTTLSQLLWRPPQPLADASNTTTYTHAKRASDYCMPISMVSSKASCNKSTELQSTARDSTEGFRLRLDDSIVSYTEEDDSGMMEGLRKSVCEMSGGKGMGPSETLLFNHLKKLDSKVKDFEKKKPEVESMNKSLREDNALLKNKCKQLEKRNEWLLSYCQQKDKELRDTMNKQYHFQTRIVNIYNQTNSPYQRLTYRGAPTIVPAELSQ